MDYYRIAAMTFVRAQQLGGHSIVWAVWLRVKPEPSHSESVSGEYPLVAEWSRPVFGTARHEAASEDQVLSVSKVASNSSGGVPGIGHNRPLVIRSEFTLLARRG